MDEKRAMRKLRHKLPVLIVLAAVLLSLAISTIRKHSHQIGDTHWRNHLRIHTADLLIESESKIVVLLHNVLLSLREDKIALIHFLIC